VLSVSSLFLTWVGVYVGVCVSYARTRTHCTDGVLGVSPGVRMRHLEGPESPDGLNFGIHTFEYVYNVHTCMYMLRGRMRSWTNCFFLQHIFSSKKGKAKDVNANHR